MAELDKEQTRRLTVAIKEYKTALLRVEQAQTAATDKVAAIRTLTQTNNTGDALIDDARKMLGDAYLKLEPHQIDG